MNKIYQKITHLHPRYNREAGIGDCHSAALASILNISLDSIPSEIRILPRTRSYYKHRKILEDWLKKRFNLSLVSYWAKDAEKYGMLDRRYYIANVRYSTSIHSIVGYSGSLVHDPSPLIHQYRHTLKWYPRHQGIYYYDFLCKTVERTVPYYGGGGTYIEKTNILQLGPEKLV